MLIDYCNDQCDLNPASAQADGPPDEWVKWVCERFAEFVWRKKHNIEAPAGHSMWLPGGNQATLAAPGHPPHDLRGLAPLYFAFVNRTSLPPARASTVP